MTDSPRETPNPLHMIQLQLEMRGLTEIGKMHSLPLAKVDDNYLVHCALGKLFQGKAPKPFAIEEKRGRFLRVLGYADADAESLQQAAQTFAEPSVYDRSCDWEHLASKPMPTDLPEGMTLQFEVRVCPVIRKSSAGSSSNRSWRAGQEIDAFLAKVWEIDDDSVDVDRESVYRDWLVRQFKARDGARLDPDSIAMTRFSIARMLRRRGDRSSVIIKRPDATLTGKLMVTDGKAFAKLLASGIGRHKSFGFGMLKIRPA